MKKHLKLIAVFLIIAAIITSVVFVMYKFKPDSDFENLRNSLSVSAKAEITDGNDKIHFLNTGSSDAILIESNGKFALVDCAEDTDNPRGFAELELDGYEDLVLDYLKKNAVGEDGKVTLEFVLGTHCHSDHIGGFDTIISDKDIIVKCAYLKEYKESQIYDSEVNNWDNKEVYEQMLSALNNKNIPIISQMDSTPFRLGNFTITLLNTVDDNSEGKVGENDNSLGVLIEKNKTRIFLSGDIDNVSGDEDKLAPQIGKVDLLKIGHHSYSHSTTTNWLEQLDPETCVITNDYEKIDWRTVRRITRIAKSPILITGKENGIIAVIGDNGKISYYNDIH